MLHILEEAIHHVLHHNLRLLPFLFITYLVMAYLEKLAGKKTQDVIQKAGKTGPIWGALCGAFPQCGFSAAASYFYVRRAITLGTLIAVYMSTSDEMLPILISSQVPFSTILKLIGAKVLIGMISGFIIELIFSYLGKNKKKPSDELTVHTHFNCSCSLDHHHHDEKILLKSIKHTLKTWGFIMIISFIIEVIVHSIGGHDAMHGLFNNIPVIGEMIAGLVGLIPNCAASVVITQLYLEGIIGVGPMMAGLLVSAGVGLLVLYKENHNVKENIFITIILYVTSVLWGIGIGLIF